jgi:hypothetical protein
VAERDGAAVDVEFFRIDAELANAREHLRCEGFVELDQIDLFDCQAGASQRFLRRGIGPTPM